MCCTCSDVLSLYFRQTDRLRFGWEQEEEWWIVIRSELCNLVYV